MSTRTEPIGMLSCLYVASSVILRSSVHFGCHLEPAMMSLPHTPRHFKEENSTPLPALKVLQSFLKLGYFQDLLVFVCEFPFY